jgi:hypothetical protein
MNTGRRLMRYAAAAILTGAVAIAGWFYFNKDSDAGPVMAQIEKISDDTKVSEDDMSSFLESETLPAPINTAVVNDDIDESDIKEMLADVSEDELQQYITTL